MNSNNPNDLPLDDFVLDTRRILVLYSEKPDDKGTQQRAKKLEEAWEAVYGEKTCKVVVLSSELGEKVESLV